MTSRERVLTALDHLEPDRVPIDLGQAAGDGITVSAYRNLIIHLGLPNRPIRLQDKRSQTACVDEDILQRFHVDFRRVDLDSPDGWRDEPVGINGYRDEWGVVRVRPEGGFYYDIAGSPLSDADPKNAIERHHWPDPDNPGRFRGLRERARNLYEGTDFAVVLQVNCAFFLRCAELRGWENFFADLAGNPEFAVALMNHYLDVRLKIASNAMQEVGNCFDIVVVSTDDLGMIDRTIVSPKMYHELIQPIQRRTFDFFKAHTPARMFCHCDGAIYPLLEDFIEIGVDVLNPIQVSAKGMGDTGKLKKEFGDRLSFWGAIDTHRILPFGTTHDVRLEVLRRITDLGPHGGYVLCAVHNIQPEVPPENVVAMYDAAWDFGRYPLAL